MIRTSKGHPVTTDPQQASSEREELLIKTAEEGICLRMLHDKEYLDYLLLKTAMKEPKLIERGA